MLFWIQTPVLTSKLQAVFSKLNDKEKIIMKKLTILLSFLLLSSLVIEAQPPRRGLMQDRFRELESRRVAFITRELSLTPEEARVFWPVYNEYHEKRLKMMVSHRNQRIETSNIEDLDEKELLEIADNEVTGLEEMASLRREYHEKFKEILPILKVVKLYNAERGFNRQLLEDGRGGFGPGRGRN
jgi:hypothetical protein